MITFYLRLTDGNEQVYPFTTWKLYTQPHGWHLNRAEYRIYSFTKGEMTRHSVNAEKSFTTDEYIYTLNYLTNQAINDSTKISKLKSFASFMVGNYNEYAIVKETYNPFNIFENSQNYDTTTVLRF